jgi:hypothetical protein
MFLPSRPKPSRKENAMPRRKKPDRFALKGKRLLLHPCHLQQVYGERFVRTTNQVLRGQLTLLSLHRRLSLEANGRLEAN